MTSCQTEKTVAKNHEKKCNGMIEAMMMMKDQKAVSVDQRRKALMKFRVVLDYCDYDYIVGFYIMSDLGGKNETAKVCHPPQKKKQTQKRKRERKKERW